MHMVRPALLSFAALALAACGQNHAAQPSGRTLADDGLTTWGSVLADDMSVPQGVTYTPATVDGATAAEISGVPENARSTDRTGGVSVRLPAAIEAQAGGHRIQVTVRAAATQDGAIMGVAYSTADVGNSGWQRFVLTTTPRDYVFGYDVAPVRAGNGDYLGFRSYGAGAVQVLGYKVELVPAAHVATAVAP